MRKFFRYFWVFIIGSFLGCLIEEIWCLIKSKKWQIRKSLIYLPLIPIYGIAGVLILEICSILGNNKLAIFGIGFVIATLVEYISSFVQEKIFLTKSWDYSNIPFNLKGRVNLFYSIAFGLCAVLFIDYLKVVGDFIYMKMNMSGYIFSFIFMILFILDVFISFFACYRQKKRRFGIKANNNFERYIDVKYDDKLLNKIYNNCIYIEK